MSRDDNRTLVEELVVLGTYDWVSPSGVLSMTYYFERDDRLCRTLSFGAIIELVVAGLMIPGSVPDREFVAWETSIGESLVVIVSRWLSEWGLELPDPDPEIWLSNTPAGDALAAAVLAREGSA